MSDTQLEEAIEALSMTFVLEDVSDPGFQQQLVEGFEAMAARCHDKQRPDLEQVCRDVVDFIHAASPFSGETLDVVSQALTALQAVVRGTRSLASAGIPDPIGSGGLPEAWDTGRGEEKQKQADDIESAALCEAVTKFSGRKPDNVSSVLRHPGNLPDHLDEDDFAGFLSVQDNVLENIESLLFELEAGDIDGLPRLKRLFHTMKGEAGFLRLDDVERLCHRAEDVIADDARNTAQYADALFQAKDWLTQAFEFYRGKKDTCAAVDTVMKLLDSVAVSHNTDHNNDDATLSSTPPASISKPLSGEARDSDPMEAGLKKVQTERAYFNVDAERIDHIVNMIGELVIVESMIAQSREATDLASPAFSNLIDQLAKISQGLQRSGLSLRMVPIRPVFLKLRRIVRDLSRKEGKIVEVVITGEDTELDKTIVDRIVDPLMHIIRNSVDHGIEDRPADRSAVGKPESATIEVRAFHEGGNICIEVADDGRGIDTRAIRKKAEDQGLIDQADALSPEETHNLIFTSGFSTAGAVTDVSGRGVGLDVVRNNLNALKGRVSVFSEAGRGTTFSIRIPVTLAIIDGMIIRVGEKQYIIPALSVVSLMALKGAALSTVYQRKAEMVRFDDRFLPILRLDRLFRINGGNGSNPIIVVVANEQFRAGIVVDEVLGKQQVVIKSLGESMQNIPGVSGGAIMGDGRVGLVLDVGGIVRLVNSGDEASPEIADQP
ncbi:MAG: chemotaxis protein CheA [Thermodesulfobacteriota bacterium]|nr:chemotaxis protein CheA [Thermodesulfobacteriota bacterium]